MEDGGANLFRHLHPFCRPDGLGGEAHQNQIERGGAEERGKDGAQGEWKEI